MNDWDPSWILTLYYCEPFGCRCPFRRVGKKGNRNVKSGKWVAVLKPSFLKLSTGGMKGTLAKRGVKKKEREKKGKKSWPSPLPSPRGGRGEVRGRGGGRPISDPVRGKNTPSPSSAILKNEPSPSYWVCDDRNQCSQLCRQLISTQVACLVEIASVLQLFTHFHTFLSYFSLHHFSLLLYFYHQEH